MEVNKWFQNAIIGEYCCWDTKCEKCKPSGFCDYCDTMYGRWLPAVNEYASSCDDCGEMTMHESMVMDKKTQLGYCISCAPKMGIT